jgi:hypothetical protein
MAEYRDLFPELPRAVDVGGDQYYIGSEKPIELGFKSYKNFQDSFGKDPRTEQLIRKYLFYSLKDKKRTKFETPEEKQELINILKKRANQIEESKQYTSSTLKNTQLQRSYLNIQRLIQLFEGPEYKGFEFPKLPEIPNPFACEKAKKYVREIPQDHLFQIILEIAWYLLHPDKVPEKVQCDWANIVKQLDTLRLGDVVGQIRQLEQEQKINPSEDAFNYFKKINIQNIAKADTLDNALKLAKDLALKIQGENANDLIKQRLKTLLEILTMKKYLSGDILVDEDRMKIIDAPDTVEKIKKSMITNPMTGGAAKTLEKPLGVALNPMFDYFKAVYYPIYDFVESNLITYSKNIDTMKRVIIPQLTTILHTCNNLNPAEEATASLNTYGIYRILNVDPQIIDFMNSMLKSTATKLTTYKDDIERNIFNQQLFKLPKVRLSSLVNKFENIQTYKDPEELPYIQFFTIDGNMTLLSKEKFMDPSKPEMTEEVFNAVTDFFKPTDLYIVCTKSTNVKQNIPMNVYQIDYDKINVSEKSIPIDNISTNYFNKNKEPALFFENLVTIEDYVVFNDAELALSIFISLKELMPK